MRDSRLDVLRILMTVFVIAIHTFCSGDYSSDMFTDAAVRWINEIFHMAVPMFIMISATCSETAVDQPLARFYRRRLARLLMPFVPVSFFFVLVRVFRDGDSWWLVLTEALKGVPYYHLWFVPMLACMVIFMPLCARIVRELPLCVALLLAVAIALYMPRSKIMWFYVSNISYVLIGLICSVYARQMVRWEYGRWCGFLALAVGFALINYNGYCSAVGEVNCIPEALRWPVPVGLIYFGTLSAIAIKDRFSGIVSRLASLTFGVYLIHPVFKGVATALCVYLPLPAVPRNLCVFALTAAVSFLFIDFMSRIRFIAGLFGVMEKRKVGVEYGE